MISFLQAHGMDAGPLQRPLLAGGLSGLAAAIPAGAVFAAFGSFRVAADQVFRLPRPVTGALLAAAFVAAGVLYGLIFRRAANDRRGGWLFGAVFGFVLWISTPVAVLPLISAHLMAAGRAAEGFLVSFLVWGIVTGGLFPYVHKPLHARFNGGGGKASRRLGPMGAALTGRILRRPPRRRD
jgi:hypothetical protein